MLYLRGAYQGMNQESISEDIRRQGFDPIPIRDTPHYHYPEHEHPETKLLVILNGSMEVVVQNQSYQCQPGDKLLIPGCTPHSALVGPQGCTFFWSEKVIE